MEQWSRMSNNESIVDKVDRQRTIRKNNKVEGRVVNNREEMWTRWSDCELKEENRDSEEGIEMQMVDRNLNGEIVLSNQTAYQ